MIQELYRGYTITAWPEHTAGGKWAVSVTIEKDFGHIKRSKRFFAEDNIHYILEIEAAKESLNLGKNLIKSSLAGF